MSQTYAPGWGRKNNNRGYPAFSFFHKTCLTIFENKFENCHNSLTYRYPSFEYIKYTT